MRSLISLLLIPLFVLGQPLPHSHAWTGVEQPSDHAARPHVHLPGGHSHHPNQVEASHHHDGKADHSDSVDKVRTGFSCPPICHDTNAIYLAAATGSASRVVVTEQVDLACAEVIVDCLFERAVQPKPGGWIAPPERFADVPIYLRVASLRI